MTDVSGGIFLLVVIGIAVFVHNDMKKNDPLSASERKEYEERKRHGYLNENIICPHCQEKGYVHTKSVQQKKGISGGKATAALLTGGVSVLATGLSRKEKATEAYCGNCKSTWSF